MNHQFVLSIDQGTTGTTVLIIDISQGDDVHLVSRATVEFPQYYPKPSWVEHNLNEISLSIKKAAEQAIAVANARGRSFSVDRIVGIGITNQRETLCIFDRQTAKPVLPAIVWQCRRSADICNKLRARGLEDEVRAKTGLLLDPYFTGSKIKWVMDSNPQVASGLRSGQLVLGTIDSFVLAFLTAGKSFATEASNASRTLLFDIHKQDWDDTLLEAFGVPGRACLPEVKDSAALFGHTSGLDFLPDGIPITAMLGDQQAALCGQACFEPGESKCTLGTGAFLLLNTGTQASKVELGMLATVAWRIQGKTTYALEGSVFIAGAAMQFVRDQLHFIENVAQSERVAIGKSAAPDVYFVPALTGLGAPHWDPAARGAFLGLTRGTDSGQLVRATLEGICLQVVDLIRAMNSMSKQPIKTVRVDGGAAANDLLCRILANFAKMPVDRPKMVETTGLGVGMMAALGANVFSSLGELASMRRPDRVFAPDTQEINAEQHAKIFAGWQRAVQAVRFFAKND